jgi:hypothetical protein
MPETNLSELDGFSQALSTYANARGVSLPKALKEQMGLLAERLIDWTPPKTKEEGQKKTHDDVWYGLGYLPWFWKRKKAKSIRPIGGFDLMKEIVRLSTRHTAKNDRALERIFQGFKSGPLKDAAVGPMIPAMHHKNRDNRGVIRKKKRWDYVTTDHKAVRAYTKQRVDNVGMAKGGWVRAAEKFGRRVPQWYGRHRGRGRVWDKSTNAITDSPYILMRNRSPWSARDTGEHSAEARMTQAIGSRVPHIYESIKHANERDIMRLLNAVSRTSGRKLSAFSK